MEGVLLDVHGQPLKFFSLELTRDQRRMLGEGHTSSIIFEAELCAAILAMVVLRDILCGRPVGAHIDNNSARDVPISGSARNRVGIALTKLYLTVESLSRILGSPRVPSPSNCADEHSRKMILDWRGLRASECTEALASILEVCPLARGAG